MTYASVATGLVDLLSAVPGIQTAVRGEQFKLGLKGSVVPTPDRTPAVVINRGYVRGSGRAREIPATLDGKRWRHTPYQVEVWDYVDPATLVTDEFSDLADSLERSVRRNPTLNGLADTAFTHLLQVKVTIVDPLPRPFAVVNGQSLLRHTFTVEAWEEMF